MLLLFTTVLEVLAAAVRQEKEIKGIQNDKERSKTVTICRGHDTTKPENPNKLELMNSVELQGTKPMHRNLSFLYTTNKVAERELKKTHLQLHQKE